MCVALRNGVEMWLEDGRSAALKRALGQSGSQFIEFEGEMFNRADVVGVFRASTMEDVRRRKNGQWQCRRSTWHDRGQGCDCRGDEPASIAVEEITDEQRARNVAALAEVRQQIAERLIKPYRSF